MTLTALKDGTRAWHARLDSHPRLVRLMQPNVGRGDYLIVLRALHGYYEPLEQALGAWTGELAAHGVDVAGRGWSEALARDLRAFEAAPARTRAAVPALSDAASAFGCFYVLAGAALGGQVIARHLSRRLGLTAATGAAFFTGAAAATRERWERDRLALRSFAAGDAGRTARMVAAAQATFAGLARWLDGEDDAWT